MPGSLRDPDDPREWLRRALGSLAHARDPRTSAGVLYEDLCFDAQQAAEKAIKALLISRSVDFPRTHSILHLLDLAERAGVSLPEEIRAADALTRYAWQGRYPAGAEDVSRETYLEVLQLAESVVRWAEALIADRQ
jgi:HEPN domain-containing protein